MKNLFKLKVGLPSWKITKSLKWKKQKTNCEKAALKGQLPSLFIFTKQ